MSQFTHYPPVSDKQLGFFIDSSRCSGCKACQVACKDKNNLEVGRRFRRVYEVKGGSFIPTGQGGSAIMYLLIRFPFPATTVRTLSAPKIARLPLCINARATASCALIPTNASAVAIAPGPALTARRSLTSRPAKCPSATCALIYWRKVNRPSVSRPVRWRPSSLARLMNCARSTVAYATFTGCQIHP